MGFGLGGGRLDIVCVFVKEGRDGRVEGASRSSEDSFEEDMSERRRRAG